MQSCNDISNWMCVEYMKMSVKCCLWGCVKAHVSPCLLPLSGSQRGDFANVRFWDSRHSEGLISKRLVPVKVSKKNVAVPIISANLGMPSPCSVLACMYVSREKHRIVVLSVNSAKGCTEENHICNVVPAFKSRQTCMLPQKFLLWIKQVMISLLER